MSQYLFSMISSEKLHLSLKDKKIIPAEEFSLLLDGKKLIEQIQQEALKYKQDVTQECESIKEIAFQEGFEEGFNAWSKELAQLETLLAELKENLKQRMIPLALQAAKKMVSRELELSPEVITDIVKETLKPVAQHKKITVYVSPDELKTLEEEKPRLREIFEHLESLSIRPRNDIQKGGCIVETEGGIINAKIEQRWYLLEKAFKKMAEFSAKVKPDPLPETSGEIDKETP